MPPADKRDDAGESGAYKLPIADVVNGELKVVPRAVMSYAKMDERAPWER
ncbi:hypothetical protein ACIBHY_30600 [Nonomuraea sp. NPDC050547]